MKIDTYPKGPYQILKVGEDVDVIADLSELQFLVEGYLERGQKYIAVSFTNANYIYSGAIAVLVECYKKIRKGEGVLCILEPKKEIKFIFDYLGIDKMIPVYDSEDDLPMDPATPGS